MKHVHKNIKPQNGESHLLQALLCSQPFSKSTSMGFTDSLLSEPLLRNPEVSSLVCKRHDEPYNSNLCLFRATDIRLFRAVGVETQAKELFHKLVTAKDCDHENFTGVSFDQVPIIEKPINQNILSKILTLKGVKILIKLSDAALNDMMKT